MSPRRLALLVTAALALAACGDDTTTSTTTTSGGAPSTTQPLDSSTTVTIEQGTTITVTVVGGSIEGGVQSVRVDRGEQVTLHVTSDEDDEVHVHGYDLVADVGPGAPATIEFLADIPGQFEIELHHLGPIAELTVS